MTEVGLRERKKAATRSLIIDTADRLFMERGFDDVTLEEVAAECVISVRTVLRYFDTKETLALAWEYDAFNRFRSGLDQRPGSVIDYWRNWIETTAEEFARRSAWHRRRREFIRHSSLTASFLHIERSLQHTLASALEAEATETDPLAPTMLAAVLIAGNETVIANWLNSRKAFDPKVLLHVVDYACELFAGRIGPSAAGLAASKKSKP